MLFVYCVVLTIAVVWLLLVASGWLSLRWSRRSPERRSALRLVLAIVPVVIGFVLFGAHLRWSMNSAEMNLSWPFVIPIIIGIVAIVHWFRAGRGQKQQEPA